MLSILSSHPAAFLLLLSLYASRCKTFLIHVPSAEAYGSSIGTDMVGALWRLARALNATVDMAEIGATGSTSTSGPSPFTPVSGVDPTEEVLPSQYLTNVQNWMFGDAETTSTVQRVIYSLVQTADFWNVMTEKLQGIVSNINWAMDESSESQDPIMITFGADYLVLETGADGVLRWYDPWTDIFESAADDTDIIACRTQGPYEGRTVMAVVRDIRMTNWPNTGRWIIHICKAALIEQPYRTGVPQTTINLLEPTRNMIIIGPKLFQATSTEAWREFYIDSFRWMEYTLINALLNIRQVEDSEASASDASTTITDYTPWDDCLTHQTETIDCQALYALAASLFYDGVPVNQDGRLGIYSL